MSTTLERGPLPSWLAWKCISLSKTREKGYAESHERCHAMPACLLYCGVIYCPLSIDCPWWLCRNLVGCRLSSFRMKALLTTWNQARLKLHMLRCGREGEGERGREGEHERECECECEHQCECVCRRPRIISGRGIVQCWTTPQQWPSTTPRFGTPW